MSCWLNYLVATPLVGVAFREDFFAPGIFSRAAEFVIENSKNDPDSEGLEFSVKDNATYSFDLKNGHEASLSLSGIIARFRYPLAIQQIDILEYEKLVIEPRPYEDLLNEVVKQMEHYCACVQKASDQTNINVYRLGFVALLETKRELLPPGLSARLDKLDPNNSLVALNHNEVIDLSADEATIDRCHYSFYFDTAVKSDGITVKLDWQRIWADNISIADVVDRISKVARAALEHFEEVGADV